MGDDAYTEFFNSRKQIVEDGLAALGEQMEVLRVKEIQLRSELTKIGRMALMLADEPRAADEGKQTPDEVVPEPRKAGAGRGRPKGTGKVISAVPTMLKSHPGGITIHRMTRDLRKKGVSLHSNSVYAALTTLRTRGMAREGVAKRGSGTIWFPAQPNGHVG